jgi:hypothetical protein
MRRLLTHIASIASEILDGFPVEFWRIAEDHDSVAIVVSQVTPACTSKWLPPVSQTEMSGAA